MSSHCLAVAQFGPSVLFGGELFPWPDTRSWPKQAVQVSAPVLCVACLCTSGGHFITAHYAKDRFAAMSSRSIIDTHRPILHSVFNSSTSLDQLLSKRRWSEYYWPAIKSAQAASIRKTPIA